ncbi:MAG TPA: serine/threonine-protein kinase [Terriglobales bacterium]|nr:serine/threonine-protein kinase [Terriglobales bacterium]
MSYQVFVLRPLASGGNADVHLGQRSDTGAQVVVKYLREWQLEHARKAFEREVRILGQNLPGMISILFADLKAQQPYYVMPYLPGGSATKHAGRLAEQQLLALAFESARSLAALHSRRIAHGDFKPDNLLITEEGSLRLADPLGNGIGCTVLFSQNHGGTPGYWAPEIKNGGPISQAGDVYSYGVTLHHLATGVKPRDGQPLDLALGAFKTHSRLTEIVAACCRPLPAERPSMQEVLQMLEGSRWTDIQQQRQQQRALALCAVTFIGILVLVAAG